MTVDLPSFNNSFRPSERILVFDCHEAWVYQLRLLRWPLDIIVGLRGRHIQGWDERMRPVPAGARLLRLEAALWAPEPYGCIVAHNLTDLLDCKTLAGPRLLVIHERLEGAAAEQHFSVCLQQFRSAVARFVELTGTYVAAVSERKGRSWGFHSEVIPFCADPADYLPWRGDLSCGIRIANHITRRPRTLMWNFHEAAFEQLPVKLIGHNPDLEGVCPSSSWNELKELLSRHRFYIHTADEELEDGYNMATLEAMAAGLPVLGNRHPSSPIEHGVSGFLSNDPAELRSYAIRLLDDRALASRMGQAAQRTVEVRFGSQRFKADFARSIERSRAHFYRFLRAKAAAPTAIPRLK